MQVSDFSALRYDSKCVRPRKLLGSWIKMSSWLQKEATLGQWESTTARLLWRGWGVCGVGVHSKVCFRFTKNMDQKQNSLVTLQRHLHRRTPQRSRYMLQHKKVPTPSKPCWGQSMWACGMCYAQRHRWALICRVQTSLSWALSVTSAADAQGPVSLCASGKQPGLRLSSWVLPKEQTSLPIT